MEDSRCDYQFEPRLAFQAFGYIMNEDIAETWFLRQGGCALLAETKLSSLIFIGSPKQKGGPLISNVKRRLVLP